MSTNTDRWPLQSACRVFYGDPSASGFEARNLVLVPLPFTMHMDDLKITRMRIHKKCAASLKIVLDAVHASYSGDMAKMAADKALEYSGSYNFRPMRGSARLSMHAYGCAIDIAASINPMGKPNGYFGGDHPWVVAFEKEGWTWGGRWKGRSYDPMHFQAARIG